MDDRDQVARLDELLTNGEGVIERNASGLHQPWMYEGVWKWVRVYRGSEMRRAIATFYLRYCLPKRYLTDEPVEISRALPRKKLPPNPGCTAGGTGLETIGWLDRPDKSWQNTALKRATGYPTTKWEHGSPQSRRGIRGGAHVWREPFLLPEWNGGVEPEEVRDPVWTIDNFRIRTTKLVSVLHGFRSAGIQRVPVNAIKEAVERL
ncbi:MULTISPECIES: hypothetical protein [Corynebacterium]|uniref:hypothetical protein n=1 Tax=Corynebacterium TaxID=1716 RepID=UPI00124CF75A|nr:MULTISPECIES: hypothetical protein [Corynebacterium]